MLGVGPRLHLTHRHQTRLDQIIGRRHVVADRNDAVHTLGHSGGIHTSNSTQGVSHS